MTATTIPCVWTRPQHSTWVRHKVLRHTPQFIFASHVGDDDDGSERFAHSRQQPPARIKTARLLAGGYCVAGSEGYYLKPELDVRSIWREMPWGYVLDEAATQARRERDPAYWRAMVAMTERQVSNAEKQGPALSALEKRWLEEWRAELAQLRAKLKAVEGA